MPIGEGRQEISGLEKEGGDWELSIFACLREGRRTRS